MVGTVFQARCEPIGDSPEEKNKKRIKGLENIAYEKRLKELAFFSKEKHRLRRNMITTFKCVKG